MKLHRFQILSAAILSFVATAVPWANGAAPQLIYRPVAFSGIGRPASFGPNLGYEAQFNSFTDNFSLITPGPPSINQHGDVSFRAVARQPGQAAQMGIWTNFGGSLHPVAYGGGDPFGPNLGAGVWFGLFFDPIVNDNGDVVFGAIPYGPNVTFLNTDGIWSASGLTMTPVASVEPRAQNPLSGLAAHTRYQPATLAQNNVGEVAFVGLLIDFGATVDNEFGVFTTVGGPLRILAREGDNVPKIRSRSSIR